MVTYVKLLPEFKLSYGIETGKVEPEAGGAGGQVEVRAEGRSGRSLTPRTMRPRSSASTPSKRRWSSSRPRSSSRKESI